MRFAVKESFKGMTNLNAVSDNGSGGGDCSCGKMDVGRDYLIYAGSVSEGSVIRIATCSRTHFLEEGWGGLPSTDADELALLRKPGQQASVSPANDAAHLRQEDDIREAVFRYQFDHNASGQQKSAHDYFLAIGDKNADPSDAFMKRLAHNKPAVRKASACRVDPSGSVVNKRTGKHGLLFRIGSITWISDTEVKVWRGYDETNPSSSGSTYTVKKDSGKWIVAKDQMEVISRNPR